MDLNFNCINHYLVKYTGRGEFLNQNMNICGLKINLKMNGIQNSDLVLQFTFSYKSITIKKSYTSKILTIKINMSVRLPPSFLSQVFTSIKVTASNFLTWKTMFQLGLLSYLTPDSMPGKLHPCPPPEKKPQTTKTKTTQELKNLSWEMI